ncbi:MAG: DNA repair protein RecO [Bacteroidales bacterium]|nr:DNA repair protein RecO [Bacteroidales bacterium]MDD3702072.1 DNA repair protein RecO [Bacteroidales bacterium]
MSSQNRGIVLQHIRYGDSSLIVRIYTESHGLQSFMIKGAYKRKSRFKPALFQPLSLLAFEAVIHPTRELQFMSEATLEKPFYSFTSNIKKSTIIIFLSELLSRTLKEHTTNPSLFSFLSHSLEWFDLRKEKFSDFHLYFIIELSRHLGFYPKTDQYNTGYLFDIIDGEFKPSHQLNLHTLSAENSQYLYKLCQTRLDNIETLGFSREIRRSLLDNLLIFYQHHVPGFGKLHAHEIVSQLLT